MGFPPGADATGDIESMSLLAGQSAGLVNEIKPAASIVHELVESAARIIQNLTDVTEPRPGAPDKHDSCTIPK